MLRFLLAVASALSIALILFDAFEVMLLPRRITRSIRFARLFYVNFWKPWAALARELPPGKLRHTFLSAFGPLSILVLVGLWAAGLIAGFAALHWSLGTQLTVPPGSVRFGDYLYFSGVTFFTLGYGDMTPTNPLGRFLAVVETGLGFGFLAVIISYLPILYQAFSARELTIALLDARAGSPPSAARLLIRLGECPGQARLDGMLQEWERWSAALLESHISFPLLSFYRSQHDNQSWLAAVTAILDTSALVLSGVGKADPYQAQLTFAMARHAVVDLAQVFHARPVPPEADRLTAEAYRSMIHAFREAKLELGDEAAVARKLAELRGMYEPFVSALSVYLLLALPPIHSDAKPVDNWQTSAWMRRTVGIGELARPDPGDDHRD